MLVLKQKAPVLFEEKKPDAKVQKTESSKIVHKDDSVDKKEIEGLPEGDSAKEMLKNTDGDESSDDDVDKHFEGIDDKPVKETVSLFERFTEKFAKKHSKEMDELHRLKDVRERSLKIQEKLNSKKKHREELTASMREKKLL